MESDHEIFLGYESGAIGIIKIWLDCALEKPRLKYRVLIAP